MAGEMPTGMDEATSALFPYSMEESELGLIPKGWNIKCIGDISSIQGGKMLSREEFRVDGMFPIFGGAGVMGNSNMSNAEGFVITVGRVGAYCGQFFYHRGSAWVNNNASRIMPLESISGEWVYLFLKSFDVESIKKGAAQPFVSNSDLANSKLMMPPNAIIARFTEIVRPIFVQSETLMYQAKLLTKLRDSLLPRLISGELQIPEEMLAS
jgi:type I restriction enzyme S subunit